MDVKKVVVIALCLPIAALVMWDRVNAHNESKNAELRDAMLSYLAQPQFSGTDFLRQLTGVEGRFQMYDLDEEKIYLSVPREKFREGETLKRLTSHPETVEFAKDVFGIQRLGPYELENPNRAFFRMPSSSFRVNEESTVETSFGSNIIRYRVKAGELSDYLHSRVTFNGPEYYRYRGADGTLHRMANHGGFVSRHEPSLSRFTQTVAKRAGSTEKTVDALLYFVDNYIRYDTLEAIDDVQVMKHASEVLLTKKATCSGKTILFASMLEQLGVDYLLAYQPGDGVEPGHIGVLVAGNFPNDNGYAMEVFGKKYQYAETTAQNFIIGRTPLLGNKTPAQEIRFVQKPGYAVMDRRTGNLLEAVD